MLFVSVLTIIFSILRTNFGGPCWPPDRMQVFCNLRWPLFWNWKPWPSSYTVNAVNRIKNLHPPIRAGLRGKATNECETKQSKFSHRRTHKESWLETTTHPMKTAFRHGAVASNIVWIPSQSPFMALKGSRITFKMLNRRDLSQLTAEVLSRDPMRHIKSPSTASAAAGPPPPTPPAVPKPLLERCIGRCPRLLVGRLGRRWAKDTSRPRARLFPPGLPSNPVAERRTSHWLSTQRRGEVMAAGTRVRAAPGALWFRDLQRVRHWGMRRCLFAVQACRSFYSRPFPVP